MFSSSYHIFYWHMKCAKINSLEFGERDGQFEYLELAGIKPFESVIALRD